MNEKPVFIGGFRSGTTLLINLLGMHEDIAPWFETKFICEALRWLRVLQQPDQEGFESGYIVPGDPAGFTLQAVTQRMQTDLQDTFARILGEHDSGKASHERYPLGHDNVKYSPVEAAWALAKFSGEHAREVDVPWLARATADLINTLGEKQRLAWGRAQINKTPEIPRFAAELRQCLGGCRVIYMTRNGLDVVASALKLGWGDVNELAYNWKGLLLRTREAMRNHPGDYLEIRYEDLLTEPANVLDRVLGFCGRSPQGGEIVKNFLGAYGASAFDLGRIGSHGLDAAGRAGFESVAGDLQKELGY